MKLIPLTKGKFAMVDDEDYDFLMQWKWCAAKNRNTFYARRGVSIRKNGYYIQQGTKRVISHMTTNN